MTTSLAHRRRRSPYLVGSVRKFDPERGKWISQARCREGDPDALFVKGAAQREAAQICNDCPVLLDCRADALDNRVEFGVWGGLTERQRRAALRLYPHVKSWAHFFASGGILEDV